MATKKSTTDKARSVGVATPTERAGGPSPASVKRSGGTTRSEVLLKEIRRNTRRLYSAEQKIIIVMEGIRGEVSIAELCEAESPFVNGEIELDESYFGARRVRGVRGRGAKGKTPVFGMLKRGDKVYTQVVRNCSVSELMPIIKGKADTEAIIYSDGFKTYDGLVNFGYKKHYRVKHGENEFAIGTNHINGIENFWGLCKVRLARFRGVHKHTFVLHIKECEFRYNCRNKNIYLILLNNFRKVPLKLS